MNSSLQTVHNIHSRKQDKRIINIISFRRILKCTDASFLMNVSRHDPDFAFARLYDAGAVGADESRDVLLTESLLHHSHVVLRDALSDADNQTQTRVYALENGGCCRRRRNEDN